MEEGKAKKKKKKERKPNHKFYPLKCKRKTYKFYLFLNLYL